MPDKWPLANGNWSNAANWNGGTKPVAGDDVFADNRTLNVDESFIVATLRSTQRSGGTAGGTFNFNTGGISGSITGPAPIIGSNYLISASAASGLIRLTLPPVTGTPLINYTGNCDLTIDGGFTFVNTTNTNGATVLIKSSTGTLTLNGNVLMIAGPYGAGGNSNIIIQNQAGNTIINGNIQGPTFGGTGNIAIVHSGTGSLTINGNVTAGTLGSAISSATAGIINISGSVSSDRASAISLSGASTLTVSGAVTPTINVPAIVSSNASATNIFTGPLTNVYDTMAVQCVDMVLAQDANIAWNFGGITLYSPERLAFYPSSSDIRQGITYSDGTLSGSLIIPSPTNVIAGTPTDNTTGSAVLTPTQLQDSIWGRDLAQMTVTESIGYRLARAATTDSTGNQIASYLI